MCQVLIRAATEDLCGEIYGEKKSFLNVSKEIKVIPGVRNVFLDKSFNSEKLKEKLKDGSEILQLIVEVSEILEDEKESIKEIKERISELESKDSEKAKKWRRNFREDPEIFNLGRWVEKRILEIETPVFETKILEKITN